MGHESAIYIPGFLASAPEPQWFLLSIVFSVACHCERRSLTLSIQTKPITVSSSNVTRPIAPELKIRRMANVTIAI